MWVRSEEASSFDSLLPNFIDQVLIFDWPVSKPGANGRPEHKVQALQSSGAMCDYEIVRLPRV